VRHAFALTLALAAAQASSASAAIFTLDFQGNVCVGLAACANGLAFDQSYGDVAGQLDVGYVSRDAAGNSAVSAGASGTVRYWDTAYGDLSGVAWGGFSAAGGVPEITFTPAAGFKIRLLDLDIAGWPNTNRSTEVRVYDLSFNSLGTTGTITAPGVGHLAVDLSAFESTQGLRLQWGPDGFNGGIDNLRFEVTPTSIAVPAPGSLLALATALLAFGGLRRRA
jgi:hypothetical protein